MVSSVDGYIAKKDHDVSWMHASDHYEKGETLTEEYIEDFLKSIDCYVMGSKTYEQAIKLGWPYGDVPVTVLTSRDLTSDKESVRFYSGDIEELVSKELKPKHKNIWMVGGAQTTKAFIRLDLADEIVISIMPVLLGEGTPFFDEVRKEKQLHLKDVKAYKDGMIEMTYEIKKD